MHIQHLATVYQVEIDELPPDLQVLSSLEIGAINDDKAYFSAAAANTKIEWLRRIFERCVEAGWWLEFTAVDDSPYVPYFRFNWGPAFCLPRDMPVRDDMPEFLRHIYQSIGGLHQGGLDEAGGLDRLDEVGTIEESGVWISEEDASGVDPARAIGFLSEYTGDRLCYLPDGGGAWLTSSGYFDRVENLEQEVADFFDAMMEGDDQEELEADVD